MLFHVRSKILPCVFITTMIFSFVFLDVVRAELPDYPMTLADMEVLAGYFTGDGKYLGGLPKAHTLSREIYQCTDLHYSEVNNTASNASFCTAWSADESYGGGFQLGTCDCKYPAPNNEYCSDWICDQGTAAVGLRRVRVLRDFLSKNELYDTPLKYDSMPTYIPPLSFT